MHGRVRGQCIGTLNCSFGRRAKRARHDSGLNSLISEIYVIIYVTVLGKRDQLCKLIKSVIYAIMLNSLSRVNWYQDLGLAMYASLITCTTL